MPGINLRNGGESSLHKRSNCLVGRYVIVNDPPLDQDLVNDPSLDSDRYRNKIGTIKSIDTYENDEDVYRLTFFSFINNKHYLPELSIYARDVTILTILPPGKTFDAFVTGNKVTTSDKVTTSEKEISQTSTGKRPQPGDSYYDSINTWKKYCGENCSLKRINFSDYIQKTPIFSVGRRQYEWMNYEGKLLRREISPISKEYFEDTEDNTIIWVKSQEEEEEDYHEDANVNDQSLFERPAPGAQDGAAAAATAAATAAVANVVTGETSDEVVETPKEFVPTHKEISETSTWKSPQPGDSYSGINTWKKYCGENGSLKQIKPTDSDYEEYRKKSIESDHPNSVSSDNKIKESPKYEWMRYPEGKLLRREISPMNTQYFEEVDEDDIYIDKKERDMIKKNIWVYSLRDRAAGVNQIGLNGDKISED